MNLSNKQQEVFDEIMHFFLSSDDPVYIFSGVAGSGKSTIINLINNTLTKEFHKTTAVITLTGKAVSTLKDKGISNAQTIHSYMYVPVLAPNGDLIGFDLADPDELLEDFIIIDEGSMVNEEIFEDIYNLGKKILVVGDVNQLPPISKTDFNIMEESDYRLEEIHRLAADNPIIQLSQHILEYGDIPRKFASDKIKFIPRKGMNDHLKKFGADYDIVLCGMNKTRRTINRIVRNAQGYEYNTPSIGERVICLRNDKSNGIFNGEMFHIKSMNQYDYNVKGKKQDLTKYVITDEKGFHYSVIVHDDVWGGDDVWMQYIYKTNDWTGETDKTMLNLFDFSSSVTTWKSQGSEYQNVAFVDEDVSFFVDRGKFRYTSVTRSKDIITIIK